MGGASEPSGKQHPGYEVVDDLHERIIDVSEEFDIATLSMDEELVERLGRTPLGVWPPRAPQENRGIMIAGYPAGERIESKDLAVDFGFFTALARTIHETGGMVAKAFGFTGDFSDRRQHSRVLPASRKFAVDSKGFASIPSVS